MKIRDGLVSNSSSTVFTLKNTTDNIEDFERRLNLLIQCAHMCDYLNFDPPHMDCYLENCKIKISNEEDYLDPVITKLIYAIYDVEDEVKY